MTAQVPLVSAFSREDQMIEPLVQYLWTSRRVRPDTVVIPELPWHGRRVDLATVTKSGVTSAYELKLTKFSRVIEQAIYNQMSFDRSWIVVAVKPSLANVDMAKLLGVGLLHLGDRAEVLNYAPLQRVDPRLRARLLERIKKAEAP